MAGVLVYLNRDTIFEPLRGIFSRVTTTTDDEAGFPVNMPSSTDYRFNELGDGFSLLTDTYLYTYNGGGVQNFALQHGYVNPVSDTNSKRVLIYDKGGYDFALYNRTSEIYKQSIEDEVIVSAFLSENEHVAVVTSGGQYSNVIYIYNGNGNERDVYKYIDEKVMQVTFSPDERYLYVTLAKSHGGDIATRVVKYEIGNDEGHLWNTEISDSISFELSITDDNVMVVTDEKITSINSANGDVLSSYGYKGTLGDYYIDNGKCVFVLKNNSEKNEILMMDGNCNVVADIATDDKIKDVVIDNEEVAVLTNKGIVLYDMSLNKISNHDFEDEYVQMIKNGSDILLMGGNHIDCKKYEGNGKEN